VREAVIVEAVRSPIGKRNGRLAGLHPVDLLATVLQALLQRAGIDPALVDDHITGCVMQTGEQGMNVARSAWLAAGLPESVPSTTVDRQCGSSQQAVHFAAQGVMAGVYDVVIASGVEHMTRVPMGSNVHLGPGSPLTSAGLCARYGERLVPQGLSAEMVAERWALPRAELDAFAFRSHQRAAAAIREGRFAAETAPISLGADDCFAVDEGVRFDTSREKLATLAASFKPDGVITAGNASQISDGAAALLITSAERAAELGLRPRARFHTFALAGDDPVIMLTAPIPATRKALARSGLRLEDLDVVEVNEAFAPVPLAWQRELGAPEEWFNERVNPNGGAIALGHPLGASGARLLVTLLHELERRGGRYGLQTMCEGGGLANATIVERV
jgi:acetyl-CoA acyltransferase